MKVVVTGGSGLIGTAAVDELVRRGHEVRLIARHAADDVKRWPERVEAWPGNVADAESLAGACAGCDVVLHIAGIAKEQPPDVTFERVNVQGSRNLVAEAERAAIGRFVYVSSLGAERGQSAYHRSKRAAEAAVQLFGGVWLVVRPGNVYGPGDEIVSLLLKMTRTLPAVPVIDDGDQLFQPIWHEDLGRALAEAVARQEIHSQCLEIAGNDLTSMNDILERLAVVTGKSPARVPLPGMLAKAGAKVASMFGAELPVNDDILEMLDEENVIRDPRGNALTRVFGIEPTPLESGLRRLADELPEVLPDEGVGSLKKKRFMADIRGSRFTAPQLFRHFRENIQSIVPFDFEAEPGAPAEVRLGSTLTGRLPLRGNFQVRVEELSERHMTLVTLQGHPLAGAVSFYFDEHGEQIFFEIQVYARAADVADWVAMKAGAEFAQDVTWSRVVQRVVEESGGTAVEGIQTAFEPVSPDEEAQVRAWLEKIVTEEDVRRRGMGGT